jgi:23S rRNA (cytidine1920-2'-O)/16S rRNA (cytidine1409-2'-O)-methyltransferase
MKTRLDTYLVTRSLSSSREKAKAEILSGWVSVNGETVREPSRALRGDETVSVERPRGLFVSRGGEKLHHALERFNISLQGLTALDLGASTGGFTHCMLMAGAARVYAVDVGYGQLDYSLQSDPRVVVMDRTNARHLKEGDIPEGIDFITMDLSFISLLKVFPAVKKMFKGARGVMLIKPQFEAGKGEQKKGVVRRKEDHRVIVRRVLDGLVAEGMTFLGLTPSPLRGPAGNIEFLCYFSIESGSMSDCGADLESAVDAAVACAHESG